MKTNENSARLFEINRDEVIKRLMTLFDIHRFGSERIFLDDDIHLDEEESIIYNPETTPRWIIRPDDLKAIHAIHRRLATELAETNTPTEAPEKSEDFLIYIGGCIVSKVIILIHSILLDYNYYKVKDFPDPRTSPSSLLNPEITPDLKEALLFAHWTLFPDEYGHPLRRAAILSELYAVMKVLFDVLTGFLPCDEILHLRDAYDTFHVGGGSFDAFAAFIGQLRKTANRFANEEPLWERARAESTFSTPAPVIKGAEAFSELAGGKKRPRKLISVKEAAHHFSVSESTIGNWDSERVSPPSEYPGRDIPLDEFIVQANLYRLRMNNKKTLNKNFAEGLNDKSIAPKSVTGEDSTILLRKNGIYDV